MLDITSPEYYVFTFLFVVLNSLIRKTYIRYISLFIFSLAFLFSISYQLVILVLFSTLMFFLFGYHIHKFTNLRRLILLLAILYFVLFLYFFKYSGLLFKDSGIFSLNSFITLGISYYIFSGLSYLFEIYNDRLSPEKNVVKFSTFLIFYPKFISGLIEKPKHFFNQVNNISSISYNDLKTGSILIMSGLFKKMVISDNISPVVNQIFDNPGSSSGLSLILGAFFYSFQIYCDFSGYTDIALGVSSCLGINLIDNFKKPYFSKSVSEFWTRWHISLSTWARDYIFLPVAYFVTRRDVFLKKFNLKTENIAYIFSALSTMVIIGVWHGPKITFLIWGLLHAFYLIFGFLSKKYRSKFKRKYKLTQLTLYKKFSVVIVFVLIMFSWIIFRVDNLSSLGIIFSKIFSGFLSEGYWILKFPGLYTNLFLSIIFILLLLISEIISGSESFVEYLQKKKALVRWLVYYFIVIVFILFGGFNKSEFIYFNF